MEIETFDAHVAELIRAWPFTTATARDDYARELWALSETIPDASFRRGIHALVERGGRRPSPMTVASTARGMMRADDNTPRDKAGREIAPPEVVSDDERKRASSVIDRWREQNLGRIAEIRQQHRRREVDARAEAKARAEDDHAELS